jgi:hypothetical protein
VPAGEAIEPLDRGMQQPRRRLCWGLAAADCADRWRGCVVRK